VARATQEERNGLICQGGVTSSRVWFRPICPRDVQVQLLSEVQMYI